MSNKTQEVCMKAVLFVVVVTLTGCGTIGGAVGGAGTDLQKAGDWIKSK